MSSQPKIFKIITIKNSNASLKKCHTVLRSSLNSTSLRAHALPYARATQPLHHLACSEKLRKLLRIIQSNTIILSTSFQQKDLYLIFSRSYMVNNAFMPSQKNFHIRRMKRKVQTAKQASISPLVMYVNISKEVYISAFYIKTRSY